jgi:hypothetical protein
MIEDLEQKALNTSAEPLSKINVGIMDDNGNIEQVITLEELVRIGGPQDIWMYNSAPCDEVACEFIVSKANNVGERVAHWRQQ